MHRSPGKRGIQKGRTTILPSPPKMQSPPKEGEVHKLDIGVRGSPNYGKKDDKAAAGGSAVTYTNLQCISTLNFHSKGVLNLALIESNRYLVTISRDDSIKIIKCDWDKNKFSLISSFTLEPRLKRRETTAGAATPKDKKELSLTRAFCYNTITKKLIVGTSDGTMLVIDPYNMGDRPLILENAHFDCITDISLAEEIHAFISCSNDFNVKTWDASRMVCLKTFNIPASSLRRVLYIHPIKALAVCSYINDVVILSIENGSLVNSLIGHKDSVACIYYHPSKRNIITAGLDSVINFWDTRSFTCVKTIENIKKSVTNFDLMQTSLGFELVVAVDKDKNIKVWNVYTLDCMFTIPKAHNEGVSAIALNPSHSVVITSGEDNLVKIWKFE
jgi:WD40 repeat protein